jgi:hypothetical protein
MIVKFTTAANYGCTKPSNLYATVVGNTVTMSWSACTTGENFQIIYSSGGVNHNVYTTAYSYVITSVAPGVYTWKVCPKCSGVWSPYWSYIATFTVDSPKLEDISNDSPKLILYPNPTDKNLYADFQINVSGNYRFEIIDMLGRSVFAYDKYFDEGNWTESHDASFLAAGLYVVRLQRENSTILQSKFIKE